MMIEKNKSDLIEIQLNQVILKFQFTYLEDLQQILYNYVRTMSPDPFLEINFNFCHFTLLNCVGTDKTRDSCQYMSIKTMVS